MADNNDRGILPLPLLPVPHPQAAGRGGGRGGARRRQGRRPAGNADVNVRPPRVNMPGGPPTGPPRPMHLATESTPDRNDPLWTTGLGGAELQPMPNTEYVYSTFEALPRVTSVLHTAYVTASSAYSRRITESAMAYYCACASWYRALSLQHQNSLLLTTDEERFVEQYSALQLEIPMLLAHYLAGFGNTRVPSGRDIRFRMPDRPDYIHTDNVRGWFGRVDEDTQEWYSQYPCLAVYAARLQAEVASQWTRSWQLPAEIRPNLLGGVGPSTAFIGYGRGARPSRAQIAYLEGLGVIEGEPFVSVNGTFPLNVELLMAIQGELRQVDKLKLSRVPSGIVGSQAQLGRVVIEDELAPLADKAAVLETPYRLPNELSFPASAFCYRVFHDYESWTPQQTAPWCIWTYTPDGVDVFGGMIAEVNTLRDHEPKFLNISEFRTTPYLLRARLEALERALATG